MTNTVHFFGSILIPFMASVSPISSFSFPGVKSISKLSVFSSLDEDVVASSSSSSLSDMSSNARARSRVGFRGVPGAEEFGVDNGD